MKKKWLVHVQFLDHCYSDAGSAAPIMCSVFGLLLKEDKHAYYLASWYSHAEAPDSTEHDVYTILKSATVSLKKVIKVL